ncbi:hypothetical protein CDAR_172591 [Caerostris darwini]|uniref:Vomeronasal type-1 receptor n=1 Tax=Caerostris darwini TaxID=1538125 RepID=A0AAV4MG23_9ARAC|nr:hypothetical protein CDAR_172591 [Caerostris darwini]
MQHIFGNGALLEGYLMSKGLMDVIVILLKGAAGKPKPHVRIQSNEAAEHESRISNITIAIVSASFIGSVWNFKNKYLAYLNICFVITSESFLSDMLNPWTTWHSPCLPPKGKKSSMRDFENKYLVSLNICWVVTYAINDMLNLLTAWHCPCWPPKGKGRRNMDFHATNPQKTFGCEHEKQIYDMYAAQWMLLKRYISIKSAISRGGDIFPESETWSDRSFGRAFDRYGNGFSNALRSSFE